MSIEQCKGSKIVVIGATGFIGSELGSFLHKTGENETQLIGLSRSIKEGQGPWSSFRQCDLFSLRQTIAAMEDIDIGIYLVHSMMPSARLTQGHFSDLDLLCADNFGRAAAKCNLKQIIYVGGLNPTGSDNLSSHLQSRTEVEHALKSYGIPVTTIRAGMVIGKDGSSFQMLLRLVNRLPIMICPSWTSTKTQPVCLDDIIHSIHYALGNKASYNKAYDVGTPEIFTYRQMIERMAQLLEKSIKIISIPLFTPKLSRLWITLMTGAPKSLVGPLIESLKHEMLVRPHHRPPTDTCPATSFDDAVKKSLKSMTLKNTSPHAYKGAKKSKQSMVRSVQRMLVPPGKTAKWLAEQYTQWLSASFKGLIKVINIDQHRVQFKTVFGGLVLIELLFDETMSDNNRVLFRVSGGMLVDQRSNGKFEFRILNDDVALIALHNFTPKLPWWIYRWSQAPFHARTMKRFGKYVSTLR